MRYVKPIQLRAHSSQLTAYSVKVEQGEAGSWELLAAGGWQLIAIQGDRYKQFRMIAVR